MGGGGAGPEEKLKKCHSFVFVLLWPCFFLLALEPKACTRRRSTLRMAFERHFAGQNKGIGMYPRHKAFDTAEERCGSEFKFKVPHHEGFFYFDGLVSQEVRLLACSLVHGKKNKACYCSGSTK